jgi:hypothetical protein
MEVSVQLHGLAAFTPVEITTISHLIESWMIPKAGLNILEKKKISFPLWEWNSGLSCP